MRISPLTRRRVLAGGSLLATPSLLTKRARGAEACVVGTWGGDYARLLRDHIDDPILKPDGIDVVQDIGDEQPRVAKLYAQRRLPRASMDIACVGAVNGFRVTDAELVEPLNEQTVPNLKHVLPELRSPAFVPHIYSAQVIVYNPSVVSEPPQGFADLLDRKWKGRIGMVSTVAPWVLMGASLSQTGTTTDFDKAKAFMLKLNANGLRLYPETDSLAPAFKSGEIDVGVIWLARSFMWRNNGFPVKGLFPSEGAILYVSGMVVPKNAPNRATAFKYLNAMLQPSAQQEFATYMGYLPTVDNAPLSGLVAEQLAIPEPRPKLVVPDYAVISKAMPDLTDWWLKNIQHS